MHSGIFSKIAALALILAPVPALATSVPSDVDDALPLQAATPAARDVVLRVDEALNAITRTIYVFGGDAFDAVAGVYEVDCTGYTNRVLEDATPGAFDRLRQAAGVADPRAVNYYEVLASIPAGGSLHGWTRPAHVADLRPGDFLVYRYDVAVPGEATGHTMIVVDVPEPWHLLGRGVWRVRVSDSARSGHSADNRGDAGSGVGAGYVLVGADATGAPAVFAWSQDGSWKPGIRIVLGRPAY